MHFTNLLKTLGMYGSSFCTSQVSSTSMSSEMNITSLGEFAKGQYLISPSRRKRPREGSLAKKSMEHLMRCSWKKWQVCTL